MIKNVKINFPEFNLDKELKFKAWVNIVEEWNAWWKTTFVNTIMSLFTGYFWKNKTIPTWFASIETDKWTFNLVKKQWIGGTIPDPLARYSIVGSFFNDTKSTVEQRDILTKFLGIDYDNFIKTYINNFIDWLSDSELDYYKDINLWLNVLKEKLKTAKANEWLIIDDITRLKWAVLSFKIKEFKDVEEFYKYSKTVDNKIKEHNKTQSDIMASNSKITAERNSDNIKLWKLWYELQTKENELEKLRTEYEQINSTVCFNCGSAMKIPEDKLKSIQNKWEDIKAEIINLKSEIDDLKAKVYPDPKETKYLSDIKEACEFLKLKLPSISEDRLIAYDNYDIKITQMEVTKIELAIKEKQLSEINTVKLEDCIKVYQDAYKSFTDHLNEVVKTTWLNIELFKTQKDWEIKATFNIFSDSGTEYSQCSTGEKLIIQIKLALLFIKRFNFDFVLCDEAWTIWASNFELLKDMLKDYQVIFFKADQWKKSTK